MLLLSSINLTGGVQRRRTIQDQLQMREYFAENDLISVRIAQRLGLVLTWHRNLPAREADMPWPPRRPMSTGSTKTAPWCCMHEA